MGSVDLIRSCLDSIREISDEVSGAVLYLDAGCSEAFSSLGSFPVLLELGARAVCSLENASPLDAAVGWNLSSAHPAKKIVFITSCLLSDAHRYILRCLNMHGCVGSCSIFTSISEMPGFLYENLQPIQVTHIFASSATYLVAHSAYVDSPLGPDAFREYESLLLQDYEELLKKNKNGELDSHRHNDMKETSYHENITSKDQGSIWSHLPSKEECTLNSEASSTEIDVDEWPRLVVSVHHFPMILCALSPRVFVFPSEGTLGEACLSNDHENALSPGLPVISNGLSFDSDDVPPGATLTAHFLYELVSKMELKMEIFSLGVLSKSIGKILTGMSSLYDVGRRNKRSLGLLLVDRTLDLLTPCCHGDSLVDKMLTSLPHRKGTILSSHIKGSQLTKTNAGSKVERSSLDSRVPLGNILNKEKYDDGNTHLSEGILAFISGWNTKASGSEIVDLIDQGDKFNNSSLTKHDLDDQSGSLISNESYLGANYLEALLDRRMKDGSMMIKKWLIETLRREKIPFTIKGRLSVVSASELHYLIVLLTSNDTSLLRNKGIIQLAVAAEIALSEPNSSRWDAFTSAERMLTSSTGEFGDTKNLFSQIQDLINMSTVARSDGPHERYESSNGLLSFQDALLLGVTGYILAGEKFPTSGGNSPFSWEEEHSLKESIVDAILEMPIPPKLRFLRGLEEELKANSCKNGVGKHQEASIELSPVDDFDDHWGNWDDVGAERNDEHVYGNMQLKLELRDRVDILFKSFHKLSGLRWMNPALRDLHTTLENNFDVDAYNKRGLISKILTMVLAKVDIPGMEYHSSAVGRFFKSGFGRFGLGQPNPCLDDQSVLLIFVVGGINGLEVFEAQKAVLDSGRPDVELLLGGTTLLTPDDMFELLVGSSS